MIVLPEVGRCVRCGSPLKCVRGTIVLAVRCKGCRRGGEIVRDATGRIHARTGPAVDPDHGAHRLIADGGFIVDLLELSPAEREILFTVRDLQEPNEPVTPEAIHAALDDVAVRASSDTYVRRRCSALEDDYGLLVGYRNDSGGPRWHYHTSAAGDQSLERHVNRRLRQLGDVDDDGNWQTVLEREERSEDRIARDAFCRRCGSVYGGDGLCESCRRNVEEELVTDGGQVTTGREFLCHLCNRLHEGLGEALRCCSDRFEDGDLA